MKSLIDNDLDSNSSNHECGESADESGGKPIYKSGNEINV